MVSGLFCLLGINKGHALVATRAAFPGHEPSMLVLLGAACIAAGLWTGPPLLRAYGLLARSMLGPAGQAELALRVAHLAQTRADTIDTGAAEMRRIERDLHDGAQARLVAMGMSLDAADQMLESEPAAARALLAEARESSAKALAELRALVRGIHPPVLADRGLAEAVRALALDLPLRVHFASELPGRPPAPIESAAYFAISELLANVSKHAQTRQAWVDLRHAGGMLRIGVSDDGAGGADQRRGTGLAGIERRLAAFDGVLALSSPPGGPTVVNMEIPCVLSSPKTFSC
jgi:signal transduction histidine kinase